MPIIRENIYPPIPKRLVDGVPVMLPPSLSFLARS